MLEKAIEIEGLLRIIRDGNPGAETYTLLNKKIAELSEQATAIESRHHEPETASAHADFIMAPAPAEAQLPEVNFSEKEPETPVESDLIEDDAPYVGEENTDISEEGDEIILEFDDSEYDTTDTDAAIEPIVTESLAIESVATEPIETEPIVAEPTTTEPLAIEPIATEPTVAEPASTEPAAVESKTEDEKPETPVMPKISDSVQAPLKQTKLKSLFSLNDRFLYARELFGGNMKIFDSTLDFLEGINDYHEIEDYFYSELDWDPDKPYVAQFMEVLRPHFREL